MGGWDRNHCFLFVTPVSFRSAFGLRQLRRWSASLAGERISIHGKWVPVKQDDLRRQVNDFGKQCADPTLSPDKAQALYSLVLQPVIGNLPPSGTVAVELDEPLWGLTFEALRDGDGLYFA